MKMAISNTYQPTCLRAILETCALSDIRDLWPFRHLIGVMRRHNQTCISPNCIIPNCIFRSVPASSKSSFGLLLTKCESSMEAANVLQIVAQKMPAFCEERVQLGFRSHLDCRRLSPLQYSKVFHVMLFVKIFASLNLSFCSAIPRFLKKSASKQY